MPGPPKTGGYALVEIIVALLVFTVGALALVASSGVLTRAMANNAMRESAARIAMSRIEAIVSQCATAPSGRETIQQIESAWVISGASSTKDVAESVSCLASRRSCTASYHATIWCPR